MFEGCLPVNLQVIAVVPYYYWSRESEVEGRVHEDGFYKVAWPLKTLVLENPRKAVRPAHLRIFHRKMAARRGVQENCQRINSE